MIEASNPAPDSSSVYSAGDLSTALAAAADRAASGGGGDSAAAALAAIPSSISPASFTSSEMVEQQENPR